MIKDVQKLTGCMAALNQAQQDLKHNLQSPPILTAPQLGENLLLYIPATTHVVNTAIMMQR
jgi:hypothetical protein